MRRSLLALGGVTLFITFYLLLWPVPVDPVGWVAPTDQGFISPYASNDLLRAASGIDIGPHEGPEDATAGSDGRIYSTAASGVVLRYDAQGKVEVFAETGGRPLGIAADADGTLVVANAYLGLQRIAPDGSVETILDALGDQDLVYANNLAIGTDGKIYFSESSTKFGAAANGGSYAASLLDINEHGGHGRVIEFDPVSGNSRLVLEALNYANGVAISEDQTFLLVAETASYRILKHWLNGPRAGETQLLLDNLPAFPDNISRGMHGRFWVGLVAPRNALIDRFSDKPFVRKILQRFPARLRPSAVPHSQVIAINSDGEVLMNLHDAGARFPALTGAVETRDTVYLTTLFGQQLPFVRKDKL
jgi:sugar lactone lactonase YvrE